MAGEASGLRQRQRLKRRACILEVAASLFKSVGYSKTTVEAIADDAEVGVATVYKYFGTKEQILADLFQPQLEKSFATAYEVIENPPLDPAHGVSELLNAYWYLADYWEDRAFLRVFATVGLGEQGLVHKRIADADRHLNAQVKALLTIYIRNRKVPKKLDVDAASAIIFAIFNQAYYAFLQDETRTSVGCSDEIRRLMPVLFQPWRE
jgi:AcrR family transcriptional regulator